MAFANPPVSLDARSGPTALGLATMSASSSQRALVESSCFNLTPQPLVDSSSRMRFRVRIRPSAAVGLRWHQLRGQLALARGERLHRAAVALVFCVDSSFGSSWLRRVDHHFVSDHDVIIASRVS